MKQKQPTTKQRFDAIIKDIESMSSNAGLSEATASISRNSTINGVMQCIKHLKDVHMSGGDAGKFLNELEEICMNDICDQLKSAISKLSLNAQSITDQIVKPEEN